MIKWSFSGLKDFVNCPRQFYEVKVAQNYTKRVSEQMTYGTAVHKALEDYVRDGSTLPKNYEQYRKYVDPLLKVAGDRYAEYQMALDQNKRPCAFDATEYWVRGIADLMIVDNDRAFIVDYKTGSARNPDPNQLKLMALMAYAHFPDVVRIKAGLLFITRNTFVPEEYHRDQISRLWAEFTMYFWICRRLTPASNKWVAKQCRRVWVEIPRFDQPSWSTTFVMQSWTVLVLMGCCAVGDCW